MHDLQGIQAIVDNIYIATKRLDEGAMIPAKIEKADIESAFGLLLVHPEDLSLLGMKIKDNGLHRQKFTYGSFVLTSIIQLNFPVELQQSLITRPVKMQPHLQLIPKSCPIF